MRIGLCKPHRATHPACYCTILWRYCIVMVQNMVVFQIISNALHDRCRQVPQLSRATVVNKVSENASTAFSSCCSLYSTASNMQALEKSVNQLLGTSLRLHHYFRYPQECRHRSSISIESFLVAIHKLQTVVVSPFLTNNPSMKQRNLFA